MSRLIRRRAANDGSALAQLALQRMVGDALRQVAALDVTQRHELERTFNLVERLLDVLDEAAPDLRTTMRELLHGAGSQRASQAARLYRQLAALDIAARRLPATA